MSFQYKMHFHFCIIQFFKIQTRRRPPRPATRACFQKTHFSKKARKPTFEKWVLHDLTYTKDTQQVELLYLHSWVFHVLLPCYFNSNGLVQVQIERETTKYRYSESLTLLDFLGGDCRRFPKHFIKLVEKTAWDPDEKCSHGHN